ncbi:MULTISPECIES: mycofactocin biosynthesis glycosyltransferase MftF [unclassified Nocardioides]|uniref:mycofactocin biosynthesis glycosyltransferase MftF n=1 Tax=unclassified Nocardioides TaxID=2615069 RepID=UPI0011519AF1|nr:MULTISPECIES: mycofactocin biosynthesis glycosyltransferase MftF [unclassified Nocardioides]TQK69091.1 mycofactocin system glycosyltransferase [Nocardioides sp. SLBN-35]WGY01603.1 mycofactocin biosynthesis glycosyltransferase MftF [Nocardioides sp. QY071]
MTTATLADGFRVRLRDDVVFTDGGRLLVGGSPVRAVRLGDRARSLLAGGDLVVEDQATARLARRLLDGNLANPLLGDVEVPLTELTVVVPVRDRSEQLARCLAALVPLPVIVVDDDSEQPHRVAEVAHRHGARVHRLTTNVGPAGARNAGLRLVRTPLVAFVDSDVTIDASRLLDLARHCADPQVALVGPQVVGKVRTAPGRRARWFERYDAAASSLDLGSTGGVVRPGAATGWLPSACLVGRTDLLAGDTGGFEDGWRVAEDVDLVWRLVDAGHVVRYDPGVRADHDVRGTVRTWLGRKFFYGTGGADLAARHGDKVAPAVLSPMMALSGWALLQRRRWSLPVAVVAGAVTARRLAPQLPVEEGRTVVAARLAAKGTAWAVRQEAGLLLRHWWPLAALAAPFSRSVRRALATAVVIDLAVFLRERTGIDPFTALVARRLDDLAYGSGLWWGAIRRRSPRCLLVRRPGATGRPAQ